MFGLTGSELGRQTNTYNSSVTVDYFKLYNIRDNRKINKVKMEGTSIKRTGE